MKILKTNLKNIKQAITILKNSGIVVFPTETFYGLAGDPFNKIALDKIYKIKGRSLNKPLPLIANSFKTVKKFFIMNKIEEKIAKRYWPGPLTMILKNKNKKIKLTELAVRVSSNQVARKLANGLGGFVISTSANISGKKECSGILAVVKQFRNKKNQPDLILDSGKLKKSKPSTIIKVFKNKVKVLRPGEISLCIQK